MSGNTKIDFKYEYLKYTNNDSFIAKNAEKYGVIKIDGEEKIGFNNNKIDYVNAGDFYITYYDENRKDNV